MSFLKKKRKVGPSVGSRVNSTYNGPATRTRSIKNRKVFDAEINKKVIDAEILWNGIPAPYILKNTETNE